MSEWFQSIVGYLLLVSVTMQMLPNKKYEQYVRLFTGFLLIVVLLQPILKIGSAEVFLESKIAEFVQEQERLEEQIGAGGQIFQRDSTGLPMQERIEISPVPEVEVLTDD